MTLTEEQRGTAAFDLEKARATNELQKIAIVLAEKNVFIKKQDAEIERLRARDRQAAAAIVAMAKGAKQYVLKTHTIMKNVFDEADSLAGYCEELENIVITKDAQISELEAENKRVLLELQKSKNRNMCEERVKKDLQQAARIKELKAKITELKADLEQSERVVEARLDVIDQQAARILELEANCIYDPETGKVFVPDGHPELERLRVRNRDLGDALVEERAKQFDVDEPCPARTHHEYCDILKGLCDGFPHMWKQCPRKPEKLDAARQQLQAEGKIGPDADAKRECDHAEVIATKHTVYCRRCGKLQQFGKISGALHNPPNVWQITKEREEAIKILLIEVDEAPTSIHDMDLVIHVEDVLRVMLTEAGG